MGNPQLLTDAWLTDMHGEGRWKGPEMSGLYARN